MLFVPDLLTRIKSFFAAIVEKAQTLLHKALEKIPEKKRRLVTLCAGGGLIVLLLILMGALLLAHRAAAHSASAENIVRRAVIPPEEIFLPDEPDFLPGVMLGRERRTAWTVEDAAPFWQDPLKNGEEQWREKVEAEIDTLLEKIP
jgi:hypothetical protein